jgi:hypothetical protein
MLGCGSGDRHARARQDPLRNSSSHGRAGACARALVRPRLPLDPGRRVRNELSRLAAEGARCRPASAALACPGCSRSPSEASAGAADDLLGPHRHGRAANPALSGKHFRGLLGRRPSSRLSTRSANGLRGTAKGLNAFSGPGFFGPMPRRMRGRKERVHGEDP